VEEEVGKYRATLDVEDELDPDFMIIARTDGRGAVGGFQDGESCSFPKKYAINPSYNLKNYPRDSEDL
jgi:hypothetical protein